MFNCSTQRFNSLFNTKKHIEINFHMSDKVLVITHIHTHSRARMDTRDHTYAHALRMHAYTHTHIPL